MFRLFGIIDDFVNEVIGKIADLVVSVIEMVDIRTHLKKSLGTEIETLKARHVTLADLVDEEVSSNE